MSIEAPLKQKETKITLNDKKEIFLEKKGWFKAVAVVMIEYMWQNGKGMGRKYK